ncbi:MAG: diaminopimelate decarboxylase [Phycisphaerales bacterium]|nr:diaminopimelate decarboxylase [Phycisphaerales bacterium]
MDHFHYHQGVLHCEEVAAPRLAAAVGTPCYVYSRATLVDHYDRLAAAFAPLDPLICFALKSCSNLSVTRLLVERGAGLDLVSGGELYRALAAGVDPGRCVFAGVGKQDDEIAAALEAGVGWFNIESEAEYENLSAIAARTGRRPRAALRVNPDVDPRTHRYTTTGRRETKFGVDLERARAFFRRFGGDPHCRLRGIHLHIGSQVERIEAYVQSIRKTLALVDDLAAMSPTPHPIELLDLGGGFGADYETAQAPRPADYAAAIGPLLAERVAAGLKIVLEPGRMITANAGVLLTRVLYTKSSGTKRFVICDAGMHTLLRPSLYEAFHFAWPCRVAAGHVPRTRTATPDLPGLEVVDIVGPICESGDFLAVDRPLPPVQRGDLLAIFGTGAYGMTMASRYNSQPLPAEVLIAGAEATLVRTRETYDDLIAHERASQPIALPDTSSSAAASGPTVPGIPTP